MRGRGTGWGGRWRAGRTARGPRRTRLALPPDAALDAAQQLLDAGRPFHAHEVLEASWKAAPPAERDLWQGLAQLAVGLTHARRGNAAGAAALLRRGASRISGYGAAVGAAAAHAAAARGTQRQRQRQQGRLRHRAGRAGGGGSRAGRADRVGRAGRAWGRGAGPAAARGRTNQRFGLRVVIDLQSEPLLCSVAGQSVAV